MQPIKTTNPINPAPAKGIESFPTPVIDDVVIAEVVNSWKGDYQKLEYGTLWEDVSHAPNQGSFPEHKLVFQQPTSEDGQWIKRIWVNDRVNQDSYNYAIKYSAGSQQHPIYIRNYVVPREGYAPLPDGTPDPLFPTAVLVDEEANRTEGELDSKYITVTRVYETLPGPQVPTKRYNERGDLETVLVQTVPPNTPPDPDGLLVTSSQVVQEEMGKGVKTTSTVQDHSLLQIKEKKEGLLGETITTDDIVSPSTNPDALSQTIIASTVEQFSATKARKRTTTSTGPSSLVTTSLVDSAVGQVSATVSKSIVPIGDTPTGGKSVLQDQITAIDSVKAQRETVTVSTYPKLTSYDLDETLGVSVITEREVVDHNTPYSAPPLVLALNDRPLDQWKTVRITSRLSGLPPQRIEYATKQFTFPAILMNQSSPSGLPVRVNQQNVGFGRVATAEEGVTEWIASGANKFISITPNQLRPSVSVPTRFKTLVTFIDASTNPSEIIPVSPNDDVYKISTQSVSYSGSLFSFAFGEVLTNGFTISVTASQYDERFKGLNETITIAASSPTASQYWLNDRSSEKLISWDVEYWRSNIWILSKTFIDLI